MLDQLTVVMVAFCLYVYIVGRSAGFLSVQLLFLYVQMIMAVGTFIQLEIGRSDDSVYGWLLTCSLLTYMLVSALLVLNPTTAAAPSRPQRVVVHRMTPAMWFLFFLSACIVVVYYAVVGASAFIEGLRNSLGGSGSEDIAGIRFDAYSGSRYLFPGYVNQFKNILLPGLVVVVIANWLHQGLKRPVIMLLLCGVAAFSLLGTGQRGHFIMFVAVVVLYLYLANGRRFPRGTRRLVGMSVFFVLLGTIALGRTSAVADPGTTFFDRLRLSGAEVLQRIFMDQQEAAVIGFRYVHARPIQGGAEWRQSIAGVLPGSRGSDLPNRIYAAMFGTDRGTAPPSIWGSSYHNFGLGGVLLIAVLLAVILVMLDKSASSSAERSTLELLGIAGVFTTFAFWASDSPMFLLNNGMAVYAWMWWWGAHARRLPGHPGVPSMSAPSSELRQSSAQAPNSS